MPTYLFSGDVCHPGVVQVTAATAEEAQSKIDNGEFDQIYDEDDSLKLVRFEHDGEEPEKLDAENSR